MAVARDGRSADPPLEVPNELQPFLDFRKLTGPARDAVARVLDGDEAFRARVLDGMDAGELDDADGLFLARPDGWRDELRALARQREAEIGAREEQRQGQALQRALERAEARLDEAEKRARRSASEVGGLEAALRDARRERRATIVELDAAVARIESLDRVLAEQTRRADEAEAALAVRERELGAARTGLVDLERELARRPPRTEDAVRSVPADELEAVLARLRRAVQEVDTAVQAGETLLPDVPAAGATPAGRAAHGERRTRRRRPTALPGGIHDDSPEAARHLLGVTSMIMLVDGYNATMLAWPDAGLPDQRERLVTRLETLAARTGVEPVVVFDGAEGHPPTVARPRALVRVRFSAAGVEADDEILDLIGQYPVDQPVMVVSNDRRVVDGAHRRGANVITSTVLLDLL